MGFRKNLVRLFFVFLIGLVFGFLFCFVLFFGMDFFVYRKTIDLGEMALIFIRTVMISLFLFHGGPVFALWEIRIYTGMERKAYERLGKPWDLLYKLLGRFEPVLKKLDSVFRTCYYVLFGFPIVGVFVIGSVMGFYFCMFRNSLGLFFDVIFPHVFLEIPVYLVCASLGLLVAGKAKGAILGNNLEKTETSIRESSTGFAKLWPVIILILLISAYLEAFA